MEKKTPLYDCHIAAKGKMVSFAGYLLPVHYPKGIMEEHMAVRTHAGSVPIGSHVSVDVRGRRLDAEIIPLPFYKKKEHPLYENLK